MAARGIRLNLRIDDFAMRTDVDRLRVIFDNLISNAVKYSPNGGAVEVSARLNGESAAFEVSDEGPGVAAEERDHIFDPFFKGRARAGGSVKSSGIGLSIAQEHVLALGGRIDVAVDRSQFSVQLPLNT